MFIIPTNSGMAMPYTPSVCPEPSAARVLLQTHQSLPLDASPRSTVIPVVLIVLSNSGRHGVIHLGHCDEHSAAGENRHEFNEHKTSFWGRVDCFDYPTRTDYVVSREN